MEIEARLILIREEIAAIRDRGKIAPPRTWIQEYYTPKPSGKKYYYYRLMEATGKRSKSGSIQGKVKQYLGNALSRRYREMREAIARRNQIQVLQRRYDRLMAIYQKQLAALVSIGDAEEVAGSIGAIEILSDTVNMLNQRVDRIIEIAAIARHLGLEALQIATGFS